jgi:hypothetical protein
MLMADAATVLLIALGAVPSAPLTTGLTTAMVLLRVAIAIPPSR